MRLLSYILFLFRKIKRTLKYKWYSFIYLKRFGSYGNNCEIKDAVYVSNPALLYLGKNVHIGKNAYFKSGGKIKIGDNTHISRNVTIYSVNHNYQGICLPYDNTSIKKEVQIGENVWIGMNVNIVPGVKVGNGAIIGMGSTVVKDVPDLAIVGGNPAVILKYRDKEHYNKLKNDKMFGGKGGKLLT